MVSRKTNWGLKIDSTFFFIFMHFLSSDTTIQVEAIFTEALLPGLDTRLLHTQHLTGTRDPSKDLTTTRETLVVDCVIVALNAEIKFSTPKGFEPRSRQCRRKVYTTMPQLLTLLIS